VAVEGQRARRFDARDDRLAFRSRRSRRRHGLGAAAPRADHRPELRLPGGLERFAVSEQTSVERLRRCLERRAARDVPARTETVHAALQNLTTLKRMGDNRLCRGTERRSRRKPNLSHFPSPNINPACGVLPLRNVESMER
jgi:hypothetical protein